MGTRGIQSDDVYTANNHDGTSRLNRRLIFIVRELIVTDILRASIARSRTAALWRTKREARNKDGGERDVRDGPSARKYFLIGLVRACRAK